MFKRAVLILLFFCCTLHSIATPLVLKLDSIVYALKLTDYSVKEHKLSKYISDYFGGIAIDNVPTNKKKVDRLFLKYDLINREAYEYYIESIYQNRLLNSDEAQSDLLRATEIAAKARDYYLLYTFFSHMAFIQTYNGNAIGAIANFGEAKNQAIILNDAYLEVIIDINISDIYYRYNFYGQSLDYLEQAEGLVVRHHLNDPRLGNIIYYNKCENYFRMNAPDSLLKYHMLLKNSNRSTSKLHTYIERTEYYTYLLNHDYKKAIQIMTALPADKQYRYENIDKQNLADAWFNAGEPDSAKRIIDALLADKAQNNHPEIKYHLYELLGAIAAGKNNNEQAAYNYKMALEEAKDNVSKLIKVGDVSSRMKIDEIQNDYFQKDRLYRKERLLLISIIIVAVLAIAIVAMFYRNVKQKRHYEKLLFVAKKEELAYINSHDIRRHLTNILGIIDVLRHSDNKEKEYLSVEPHLFYSAEQLDEAIKNISQKLDENEDDVS
jgi:hypothetical protein